ncbi:MAG: hypothetical protein WD850_02705, partial [Candidatus Spechtbacterales bacterium]
IIAFIITIYVGFQYILSGESATARAQARERLVGVVVGILLLVFAVLLLQTLNPDLIRLQPISFPERDDPGLQAPRQAEPGFEFGRRWSKLNFSQAMADTEELLTAFAEEDRNGNTILDRVALYMDQCSASRCTPGTVQYSRRIAATCTACDPGTGESCYEYDCSSCQVATCRGTMCVGDPLGQRSSAENALENAQGSLAALSQLYRAVGEAQTTAASCAAGNGTLVPCSVVRLLSPGSATSACTEEDFFCSTSGGSFQTKHSIPFGDVLTEQRLLRQTLLTLTSAAGAASCSHTGFSCPDSNYCSQGNGSCGGGTGCPPELFEELAELSTLATRLEESIAALEYYAKNIDALDSLQGSIR